MNNSLGLNGVKRCTELVRKTFPHDIESIKKSGEGQDCLALEVDDKYVVKFPKNNLAQVKLNNEISLLKYFSKASLSLKTPEFIDKISTNDARFPIYSIITKMVGKELVRRSFDKLSDVNKYDLAKDLANFLSEVHSLKTDLVDLPRINFLDTLKKDYKHIINTYGSYFNFAQKQKLQLYFESFKSLYDGININYSVLHGDFSINTIYYDLTNNKACGIIDFGDSVIGDKDSDFFYLLEDKEDYPLKFGMKVVEYYAKINGTLDIELIKSKIIAEDDYWCVKQIIKGEKLADSKLIKKSLKQLLKAIDRLS